MSTTRLGKRVRKKTDIFFPDEIVINILSRLPAKSVIRFRLVCRGWRDLTSTHDFMELHLRHGIPMVFLSHPLTTGGADHILWDKWWEPQRKRLMSQRCSLGEYEYPGPLYEGEYMGQFSSGGLIVFRKHRGGNILIVNPTSHENVKINLSEQLCNSEIYGLFFHPLLREYCILWRLYASRPPWISPDLGYYKMLNLGSKPCWRDISNPWDDRVKISGTCPVLIGEYLYWLLSPGKEYLHDGRRDIMRFDIRSEKFNLMHCPVPLYEDCTCFQKILLDIDGVLSFVVVEQDKTLVDVNIWKLKDSEQQVWVPMNHRIKLEDCSSYTVPPIAAAVVGEQIGVFLGDRFYVCNLKLGTTRTFAKKQYNFPFETFSHVMSVASLKNCKSIITMDIEGEVCEESDMA